MVRFYKISSYLLMLGVVHCALTPLFFKTFFSIDAIWFFGTGLSLVFLSMLNIAASRLLNSWFLRFTFAANILGTLFSVLITCVLKEPQAYLAVVFHLLVITANFLVINQKQNRV